MRHVFQKIIFDGGFNYINISQIFSIGMTDNVGHIVYQNGETIDGLTKEQIEKIEELWVKYVMN